MSRPLNYAILKHFTTVDEACADDVLEALEGEYSGFAAFTKDKVQEALMTAEKNALIEESRFDLDPAGDLRVYYRATDEQRKTIDSYIE